MKNEFFYAFLFLFSTNVLCESSVSEMLRNKKVKIVPTLIYAYGVSSFVKKSYAKKKANNADILFEKSLLEPSVEVDFQLQEDRLD